MSIKPSPDLDLLPKAALDVAAIVARLGPLSVDQWVELLGRNPGELPAASAEVKVHRTEGWEEACEALRRLGRRAVPINLFATGHPIRRLFDVHPNLFGIPKMKTAIDLGCGSGRDSVWLGANGWSVLAVDRLQSGGPDLQAAYCPEALIEWRKAHIMEFESEPSDLVLLHFAWDQQYVRKAAMLVRTGGYLSLSAHSETHYRCFGYPRIARIFNPKVLPADFKVVFRSDEWLQDRHAINVILQKQ